MELIEQPRFAARHQIPLAVTLRRFTAAKEYLAEFVLAEAIAIGGDDPSLLRDAMAAPTAVLDRLLATVAEEYEREARSRPGPREARLVACAERLLAGEPADPSILEYELDCHHLGLVADSADARPLLQALAGEFDCRSLVLARSSDQLWVWLGRGRGPLDPKAVRDWIAREGPPELAIAIGEPKRGRSGWRLTNEQARSAVGLARRAKDAPVVEYAEAMLVASIAGDRLTMTSLRERYVDPIGNAPNGAELLIMLRAYFKAERNTSSAAEALGISRQTAALRIKEVEECIGERVNQCEDRLVPALMLEKLGFFPDRSESRS